jgi:hypothetical protein
LDGLKEINKEPDNWECVERGIFTFIFHHKEERQVIRVKPRYNIGETIYIKEPLYRWTGCGEAPKDFIRFNKTTSLCYRDNPQFESLQSGACLVTISPLFMPAWAARDFIKITKVGIGRVKKISYSDCLAEGIEPCHVPQIAFQQLWDSINKKYPFNFNPWAWEISYELLERK